MLDSTVEIVAEFGPHTNSEFLNYVEIHYNGLKDVRTAETEIYQSGLMR